MRHVLYEASPGLLGVIIMGSMAIFVGCPVTPTVVTTPGPVSTAAAPGCERACSRLVALGCLPDGGPCSCEGLPVVCVSAAGDTGAVRACGVACGTP